MKGLYIHIPFCNKICSYCDFSKVFYDSRIISKYLDALEKEIVEKYNGEEVATIYIGGGTPSCLNYSQLERLFEIINKNINLSSMEEYTIECNVELLDEEKIKLFKKNGINRLSIGVQSFNKKILDYLNRDCSSDYIDTILMCKKYFDNINIDLLYGIPNFDIEYVKKDIETFLLLDIPHISCYSLIIEPHTKLYIDGTSNIDEELEYEMYKYIVETLETNGYIHYETSNYCKKNYSSKHNLIYWNNLEYYGFGCGACGFIDGIRYSNTRSLTSYNSFCFDKDKEVMDVKTNMQNEMMLGLRKLEGVSKDGFYNRYGISIYDAFDICDLIDCGKLIDDGQFIKISPDYIYLSNDILVRFI